MQEDTDQTDLEKYVAMLSGNLKKDTQILRLTLKHRGKNTPKIFLEPEGNIEFLESNDTVELILLVNKEIPDLTLTLFDDGSLNIVPEWYGAIFRDGKGIMNY